MGSAPLLSLNNLSVWYTQGHPVLSGLSLDFGTKEAVGLIGLNGAGKTTFIKTLAGLLKGYRLDGAKWEGRPFGFRDRAFQRDRFIVFAEDRSFPYFTFREYLSYVCAAYGKKPREEEVRRLIEGFHFEDCEHMLLRELSTGNQKKAFLITAFVLSPRLLLLDEPVNGLDFQSTEFLYRQISGYRDRGSILFASHILESLTLTADRVLVLEQGRIRQEFGREQMDPERIRAALGGGVE